MKVVLRKVTDSDLQKIGQWIKEIDASQYMSRSYPKAFEEKESKKNNYLWFVIVVDDMDVGTIWAEKENPKEDIAVLGIFLGIKEKMNHGIGQTAIRQIQKIINDEFGIKTVKLNVRKDNQRAIICYQRCGFTIVREDKKVNRHGQIIELYEMLYNID